VIDFRSDTVTRPTEEMLRVMAAAPVGDDVYGEDPGVNELEECVAGLLGKEAALFVPSGTMANQIAINLHTRPGDSVLTEVDSHCVIYEAGAGAALSGVQFDLIPLELGLSREAVSSRIRTEGLHNATTTLFVLENTHNRGGGRVMSSHQIAPACDAARAAGLALHCDGARLWNAAAALDCPPEKLAAPFDSVAVCFSKGLGAPVGSALCGRADFIARARKVRKRWGGGMRQSGIIAAGALHALREHRARLKDDHENARELAAGLKSMEAHGIRCSPVQSNLVYFEVPRAEAFAQALRSRGILVSVVSATAVRMVTHLQTSQRDIGTALDLIKEALRA
jgi:threonine aldolase